MSAGFSNVFSVAVCLHGYGFMTEVWHAVRVFWQKEWSGTNKSDIIVFMRQWFDMPNRTIPFIGMPAVTERDVQYMQCNECGGVMAWLRSLRDDELLRCFNCTAEPNELPVSYRLAIECYKPSKA